MSELHDISKLDRLILHLSNHEKIKRELEAEEIHDKMSGVIGTDMLGPIGEIDQDLKSLSATVNSLINQSHNQFQLNLELVEFILKVVPLDRTYELEQIKQRIVSSHYVSPSINLNR